MNSRHGQATAALVFLLVFGAVWPTSAEAWTKIAPRYAGKGTWVLQFSGADGRQKTITSTTPDLHGFLLRSEVFGSNLLLVEEDFDDGARYGIYLDARSGLSKQYELDGVVSAWKSLPSNRGAILVFVNDVVDYDSLSRVVARPDLFALVEWNERRRLVRLNCGFREPARAPRRYARKSETTDTLLLGAIKSASDLSCRRSP